MAEVLARITSRSSLERAGQMLDDIADLPLVRHQMQRYQQRFLDLPLLTDDRKFGDAPGSTGGHRDLARAAGCSVSNAATAPARCPTGRPGPLAQHTGGCRTRVRPCPHDEERPGLIRPEASDLAPLAP